MTETIDQAQPADLKELLRRLTQSYPALSPQLRLAAKRVLDQPEDVAMKSMRGLASDAKVPPSTMVRLAKSTGFASYDEFRRIFQDALRSRGTDLVARAEWLQRLPAGGRSAEVAGAMASAVLGNVEALYRVNSIPAFEAAAELLRSAGMVTFIGVGGMHAIARYAHYVARMALADVRLAQPAMAAMIDELVDLQQNDAVVILSVAPYAAETVRTAEFAKRRGAKLLSITQPFVAGRAARRCAVAGAGDLAAVFPFAGRHDRADRNLDRSHRLPQRPQCARPHRPGGPAPAGRGRVLDAEKVEVRKSAVLDRNDQSHG